MIKAVGQTPTKDATMKSFLGRWAKRIAIAYAVIYFIAVITLLILMVNYDVMTIFVAVTVGGAISGILLFSLASAHARIDRLENILHKNKLLSDSDLQELYQDEIDADGGGTRNSNKKVTYCEKCGYQLFDDDSECPYCHAATERQSDSDGANAAD